MKWEDMGIKEGGDEGGIVGGIERSKVVCNSCYLHSAVMSVNRNKHEII